MSSRFAFEREKLFQEKAQVQREIKNLDSRFSKFSEFSEFSEIAQQSLLVPQNITLNQSKKDCKNTWILPSLKISDSLKSLSNGKKFLLNDESESESEISMADENPHNSSASALLLQELASLRMDYLKSGGTNKLLLDQMNILESQFAVIANETVKTHEKFDDPPEAAHAIPTTFEEIDLITVPPYNQYRGFSVFMDMITGLPYFGGGTTTKIDLFYAVFNGAKPATPVESVNAVCYRQAVSFVGKSLIQEVERFYDISLEDSVENETITEMKPVAWTSFDLFTENFQLNQGRCIPNMLMYIRIVNPMLQPHHQRVNITQIDVRKNNTAATEYRMFKPNASSSEFYEGYLSDFDGYAIGSLDGSSHNNLAAIGSEQGSKLLASTSSLGINQEFYTNVWIRIDEIRNLHVIDDLNAKVRVKVSNQIDNNAWQSVFIEQGFSPGVFGWTDEIAELQLKDVIMNEETKLEIDIITSKKVFEHESVLTITPITANLFQKLEGNVIGQILNQDNPCELNLQIFSEGKYPKPFGFESKKLDHSFPFGTFFQKPTPTITNVTTARFLPESCTITRVFCYIADLRNLSQLDGFEQIDVPADLDSPALFPTFMKASKWIKIPPNLAQPETLIAIIKIFTIDKYTTQIQSVGISFFNLFITAEALKNKQQNQQQQNSNAQDLNGSSGLETTDQKIYLNEGYHQIALFKCSAEYSSKLKETSAAGGENFINCGTKKVPGCSLLLRLSAKDELTPKSYNDRVYNSSLSVPGQYESNMLYLLVKERLAELTVKQALEILKQNFTNIKNVTDQALIISMGRRINIEKGNFPGIDMSCILKYNHRWGFKIAVDGAENLKNKAFSLAMISLYPASNFYGSLRNSDAPGLSLNPPVKYNTRLNFASTVRSPAWEDGYLSYENIPYNPEMLFVVDIRCLGYSEREKKYLLQTQGWAVLNVFHEAGGKFVRFGAFQLPLFDGVPTIDILDRISKSESRSSEYATVVE
ncbi:Coiled-coil domain-containing protein 17 [Physocladia obscura]|uniref:Coiled-coil domain-containing protein 17 n=1 Tax=Physocladia obscura TaxID=109957 RepID=A0AAD5TAS9_9FUNG|nr:Coiled-coil domain-containing protein 17 [Physocladia obscura]